MSADAPTGGAADQATRTARDYYNSSDADNFYAIIWGGEDIHVGLYQRDDEPIADASRRTVDHLAERVRPTLEAAGPDGLVLDMGAGYGGAARRLAQRFGCRVVCLNLSEAENERNRRMNDDAGLADRVEVIDGSFEHAPLDDASAHVVWSQDAFLHAGNRRRVIEEAARVLRPGGRLVFTDPMRTDDCPPDSLGPILERIHLSDLGSPGFYRSVAADLGLRDLGYEDMTSQLVRHYTRVLETLEQRVGELAGRVSDAYIERMRAGLGHWIDGGRSGRLAWGVFVFEKP